jgi:hypothetical protein
MPVIVRFYRDGFPFVAAMRRAEIGFLPQLTVMPGFQGVMTVHWRNERGLGMLAFEREDQLQAALTAAAAWSHGHLGDLVAEIEPSELIEAEILFSRGRFG